MLLSLSEIVDLVIMTLGVGYIFMDTLAAEPRVMMRYGFDWARLRLACLIAAPAVILHEMGHKFAALALGLAATFHAAYTWLMLGVAMKLLNTGLIFFVPGYVSIEGIQTPLQSAITAFAGPAVNLMLWGVARLAMKRAPRMKLKTFRMLAMTRQINGFLFIFNMLPIYFFDGYTVYYGLIHWMWP